MFSRALRREIIIVLAAKALLLIALYALFFSPGHRLNATPDRIRSHLIED